MGKKRWYKEITQSKTTLCSSVSREILGVNWTQHTASFGSKKTSSFAKGSFIRLSCRVALGREVGGSVLRAGETRSGSFPNGRLLNPETSPIKVLKMSQKREQIGKLSRGRGKCQTDGEKL